MQVWSEFKLLAPKELRQRNAEERVERLRQRGTAPAPAV